jgi:preprotein translocase subunit SecA
MHSPVGEWLKSDPEMTDDKLRDRLNEAALAQYASKEAQVGPELMRQFERSLMLQTLDQHWRDHLANLDHLRQGIHLRGYAQKNPKQEYKRESFELFSDMLDRSHDVVRVVLTRQVRTPEDVQAVEEKPAASNVKISMPTTMKRWPRTKQPTRRPPAPPLRLPPRRSCAPATRWVATIPVRAGPARNTSTATGALRRAAAGPICFVARPLAILMYLARTFRVLAVVRLASRAPRDAFR